MRTSHTIFYMERHLFFTCARGHVPRDSQGDSQVKLFYWNWRVFFRPETAGLKLLSLVLRSAQSFTSRKIVFFEEWPKFQSLPAMHAAWSYCQAAGLVAKRKTNQLEQYKKEESAGAQRNDNKNKWNVKRMFEFM